MRQIRVKILGVELEAPLLNHKVAKRYEDGTKKVVEIANKAMECGAGSDGIEMECNAVIDFIDDIFGFGSAKKVLGEETDLLTCLDAWNELTSLYDKQVDPVLKERIRIVKGRAEGLKSYSGLVNEKPGIKNGDA